MAALAVSLLPGLGFAQQVKLKLAHVAPPTSSFQSAAERMNAALKTLSDGTMELEIVPGGALGSLVQLWAQLRSGTLDMHLIDIGAMTPMKEAKNFTVVLMPYVFRDTEHYRHFVQSAVASCSRCAVARQLPRRSNACCDPGPPATLFAPALRHVAPCSAPGTMPQALCASSA